MPNMMKLKILKLFDMKIENQEQLQVAFQEIDKMIVEGFEGNLEKEASFLSIAKAIEYYEVEVLKLMPMIPPKDVVEVLEYSMFSRKMRQKDLASLLEVSVTRLSEIMQRKRKINLDFAKKVHEKLGIDAAFILKTA
jgi:HTH-type transcriptional regulator / antitoxin HigA